MEFFEKKPCQSWNLGKRYHFKAAIPELSPCIQGWPSENIFDGDYRLVNLSRPEYEFLEACTQGVSTKSKSTVGEILTDVPVGVETVRSLQSRLLILLSPNSGYH